jgi:hypothetical protein
MKWAIRYYSLIVILTSATIRTIPTILAWPYPLGYDTIASYIPWMSHTSPTLYEVFSSASLLQLILRAVYQVYPNAFLILNVFAICLQVCLSFSIYIYATRVAKLGAVTSVIVSTIFALSMLTLRLTWDQYRMSIGLIFSIFAIITINSKSLNWRLMSLPFLVLAILSNPLPAVFLVLTMFLHLFTKVTSLRKQYMEILCTASGVILLLIQKNGIYLNIFVGSNSWGGALAPIAGFQSIPYSLGFLLYTSWPLLIFLPLALRKHWTDYHLLWLYLILFFAFVAPTIGILTISSLWILWLVVFPLSVSFGQAISLMKGKSMKVLTFCVLAFFVATTSTYVISSPLHTSFYASIGKNYGENTPPGYLESTVPVSQESALIDILNKSISILPSQAVLYLPMQFYGLALVLPDPRKVNLTGIVVNSYLSFNVISASKNAYTIWWTIPNGWYGITYMPQNFHISLNDGVFSLYRIGS